MQRRFWIFLTLALLTLGVFGQVRNFDFISYDDPDYVTKNPYVPSGLTWDNVVWSFSGESAKPTANWSPLTWLSFMLDVQLFGTGPTGFHLTNVVLHTATVLLLFAALNEMTLAFWKSAFVAAVFAIHPLHVESVAWISERKDVLSILFGVLAIWWYTKAVHQRLRKWYVLSLGAFVLSLLSKQTLVTLPFLLLLLDYWPLRRLPVRIDERDSSRDDVQADTAVTNGTQEPSTLRHVGLRLVWEKIPFLAISALFCVIAVWSQRAGGAMEFSKDITVSTRCLNAITVYAVYLWQTVWPVDLALFYPYPKHDLVAEAAIAGLVLGFLTAIAVRAWRWHPYLLVGWLWYLGTLVPVIGIVQVGSHRMADRYTYFPMIGLLIAIAWLAPTLTSAPWWRKRVLPGCAISIVVAFAVMAHQQTAYWRDGRTLYTHSLDVIESSLMHDLLGIELAERQQSTEAIEHYQRAIELDPDYPLAYSNLGNVFLDQRLFTLAITHYRRAIDLDPTFALAYANLGFAIIEERRATNSNDQERLAEAIGHYRRAIKLNPGAAEAHNHLGNALLLQKHFTLAVDHFRRAIDLAPTFAIAHNNLGLAIIQERHSTNSVDQQCLAEAIKHFQRAIELDPNWEVPHFYLANAVADRQRLNKAIDPQQLAIAIKHYRRAISLTPGHWQAHLQLAKLYLLMGRRPLAIQHLRRVVLIKPDFKAAHDLLRRALTE